MIWSVPALTSQFLVLRFGVNFEFTSGKCVFFHQITLFFYFFSSDFCYIVYYLLVLAKFIIFFFSLHKVFKVEDRGMRDRKVM